MMEKKQIPSISARYESGSSKLKFQLCYFNAISQDRLQLISQDQGHPTSYISRIFADRKSDHYHQILYS